MNLTQGDLKAIRDIVEDVVEDSKLQTAAGFAAVDKQFVTVHTRLNCMQATIDEMQTTMGDMQTSLDHTQQTVARIERVQHAEVERNDRQDAAIKNVRKVLHAA